MNTVVFFRDNSFFKNAVIRVFIGLIIMVGGVRDLHGQVDENPRVSFSPKDSSQVDSLKALEDAPLDIAQNRGLFITTPDKKMQLRILGSVRYLVVFDALRTTDKNGFNTYAIPTGELDVTFPNYYNGLDQTRLGFEVTRNTSKGEVFIRLETDFAGKNGIRIRHAYGKFNDFLFGQTYSLFTHLNALPATVDFACPTSTAIARTPQLRYTFSDIKGGVNLALALEYLIPNLTVPDSLESESFQLVPNLTIRVDKTFEWGALQFSGIMPTLTGQDENDEYIIKPGWGVSGSVVVNSWSDGTWRIQGVTGRAITRYFTDLSGGGLDIVIDPGNNVKLPLAYGYYASYEHTWNDRFFSNLIYGVINYEEYSFTNLSTYRKGNTVRVNTFWNVTDGARIGGEVVWGNRINVGYSRGDATRLNILFYYDF